MAIASISAKEGQNYTSIKVSPAEEKLKNFSVGIVRNAEDFFVAARSKAYFLKNKIRNKPLQTSLIALATGYAIGMLVRR